jgi:polyhydroxyalkanoate synthesis regulator phasin
MIDLLKNTMFLGLGLASLTKEKIEEVAKELIKKGQLSEKEGKDFIEDLSKRSKEAGKEIKGKIEKGAADALKKMNLASRDELEELEKRIKKLEKELKKEKAAK